MPRTSCRSRPTLESRRISGSRKGQVSSAHGALETWRQIQPTPRNLTLSRNAQRNQPIEERTVDLVGVADRAKRQHVRPRHSNQHRLHAWSRPSPRDAVVLAERRRRHRGVVEIRMGFGIGVEIQWCELAIPLWSLSMPMNQIPSCVNFDNLACMHQSTILGRGVEHEVSHHKSGLHIHGKHVLRPMSGHGTKRSVQHLKSRRRWIVRQPNCRPHWGSGCRTSVS